MTEENKAIARRVYEIISSGDFNRAEEIVDREAPDNELLPNDPPAKLIDTFKETFSEARDHAAFSAMIYAGLRIEETTALTVEDLSFARGEEQIRVARGKGNKERVVPMSPKLRRSLKSYLNAREELVPAGKTPPPTSS
jgi:integrase/recombinase XerD